MTTFIGAIIFWIITIGIGVGVMRCVCREIQFPRDLVPSFLLGAGMLSYSVLLLGLCGGLNRTGLSVLVAVEFFTGCISLVLLWSKRALTIRIHRQHSPLFKILRALTALSLLIIGVQIVLPCVEWDAWVYHLAIPNMYLMEGRISPHPGTCYSQFPMTVQMLYLLGLWVKSETLVHLISWTFLLALVLSVYRLVSRLTSEITGITAAFLAAILPGSVSSGAVAMVDIPLAACGVCVLVLLHEISRTSPARSRWRMLVPASLLAGLAAGMKHAGLAILMACAAGVVLAVRRMPWRKRFIEGTVMGILGAIVASPWYIKAYIQEGNPVWPFQYRLFGGRHWTESADAVFTAIYGMDHLRGIRSVPDYLRVVMDAAGRMVALPESMNHLYGYAGGLILSFLGVLLLCVIISLKVQKMSLSEWIKTWPMGVITASLMISILIALMTRQPRFQLMAQVILIILACSLAGLCVKKKRVCAVAVVLAVIFTGVNGWNLLRSLTAIQDYARMEFNRGRYISERGPGGGPLLELKPFIPEGAHVLTWWDPMYPAATRFSLASPYQQGWISWMDITDAAELHRILKDHGITHLLYLDGRWISHALSTVFAAGTRIHELIVEYFSRQYCHEIARSGPFQLLEVASGNEH